MTTTAVDRLLAAVASGAGVGDDIYTDDATFDGNVPMWRFPLHGAAAIRAQLSRWYDNPSEFDELERLPVPGGEVVRFAVSFQENGVLTAVHQVHVLTIVDDRITSQRAWCSGRWDAPLLAEMATAHA